MRNFGVGKPPDFLRRPLTPHKEDGGTFFSAEVTMWLMIVMTVVAIIALVIAATAVGASPSCMSLKEARAKFPTQHLYWRTKNRCWSNVRGHRVRTARISAEQYFTARAQALRDRSNPGFGRRNSLRLPPPQLDASGNIIHRNIEIIDIDEIQYRQEAEARLDVCCWPPEPAPVVIADLDTMDGFVMWESRIAGAFER